MRSLGLAITWPCIVFVPTRSVSNANRAIIYRLLTRKRRSLHHIKFIGQQYPHRKACRYSHRLSAVKLHQKNIVSSIEDLYSPARVISRRICSYCWSETVTRVNIDLVHSPGQRPPKSFYHILIPKLIKVLAESARRFRTYNDKSVERRIYETR